MLQGCQTRVKFTEQGRITVFAGCEEKTPDYAVLRFTVEDTGIGMTADQLNRLFQAFNQADNTITRKYGGTGLGLAISKRLVEIMGGRIWVESVPDKGTRFFLRRILAYPPRWIAKSMGYRAVNAAWMR